MRGKNGGTIFGRIRSYSQNAMRHQLLSVCALFAAALAAGGEEAAGKPLLEIPEPEAMTVRFAPFETDADIRAIAWSPMERRLAVCDADSRITVWSAGDGRVIASWKSPNLEPLCLAWSGDGRVIAAGGREDVVAWDDTTGEELRRIHHGNPVVAVAFEPASRTLISATADGELKRTDLWGALASVDLPKPAHRIRSIAVSADGTRVAVAGLEPQIAVLSLPDGKVQLAFGPQEVFPATWVVWGAQDATLFTHINLGPLQEIDARSGVIVDAYSREWLEESVALCISPDGRQIAGVNSKGYAAVRSRRSISQDWSLQVPPVAQPFVAVSPGGSRVAVPWGRRRVRVVTMSGGAVTTGQPVSRESRWVAWSPDGATIFMTRGPTEVHAFEAASGAWKRGYVAPENRLFGLAARADGALVVATSGGGWLRVTDLTNGQTLVREPMKDPPAYAELSEDGSTFAWREASDDKVTLRDLLGTDVLPSIRRFGDSDYWVGAISPRGDIFVQLDRVADKLLYSDTTVGMPLVETGAPHDNSSVLSLRISRDGARTILHQKWGTIDVLASGRPAIGTVRGELDAYYAIHFSPDGNRIAGLGEILRILDTSDLHTIVGFPIAKAGVALAWSPDGRRIATVNEDGLTQIWSVPDSVVEAAGLKRDPNHDWGDLACQRADRAFEAAERLMSGDAETVAFLREKLAERENAEQIRRLIAQLRDESFARRQDARDELHWLGVQAEPELLRAMTGEPPGAWRTELELLVRTAEARVGPSSQNLRRQRAMQVLEGIGSADAADVLRHMAGESPSPRERQDAQEALRRIELRK